MSIFMRQLFFVLLCLSFLSSYHRGVKAGISQAGNVEVTLVESEGYNEEVWLPFAQALSGFSNIKTKIALAQQRYDVITLIEGFQWENKPMLVSLQDLALGPESGEKTDIYISATCDQEILSRNEFLTDLLEQTEAELFCVVHRASQFKTQSRKFENILPWIKKNRIRMIALSDHVAQSLMNNLGPFQHLAKVSTFPPIFSIDPKLLGREEFPILQRSDKTRRVVVQGLVDQNKYNYTKLAEQMIEEASTKQRVQQGGGTLMILGNGDRVGTSNTNKKLEQKGDLTFEEYFSTMARSDVLLIGRNEETILDDEVSSSLAAALITGTPVVANQAILSAYTYLLPDAVILPKHGQNQIQAAFDHFILPPLLHTRKRHAVTTLRKTILVQNRYKISQWIRPKFVKK